MLGKQVKLFTIFGFAVRVHASWLIIALLVTWTLATQVFGVMQACFSPALCWMLAVAGTIGLFASVVFHELCHSLVARHYGLPMKGITLFIFGGVAEMDDEPPSAKVEFLMAIAGPASSVVLAGFFYGLQGITAWMGPVVSLEGLLGWLGLINIILAAFNLIPGFPLDGGRVLRAGLWAWKGNIRWATRVASEVGSIFGFLLIALGVIDVMMGAAIAGLWLFLIGLFIRYAAKQGYQQVLVRQLLTHESVRRLMNSEPVTVDAGLPLVNFIEDYVYKYHHPMFPVLADGRLVGLVGSRQIRQFPQEKWAGKTVAEIVQPCSEDNSVNVEEDAMTALSIMNRTDTSYLLVIQKGHLAGILTLKDLMKFMALKMELEGESVEGMHLPQAK